MKTFLCDVCGQPLFFENVRCLRCGSDLAFLPDRLALAPVEPLEGQENAWRPKRAHPGQPGEATYRLCANHVRYQACNFAVPMHDPNPFCVSCRHTRVLPDLSVQGNAERWYKLEAAKRRLFYTLAQLHLLDVNPPGGGRDGPVFEFLADVPGRQVLTGHAQGVITLNIAEADDAERVKRRIELHEPYRTLLGHLRHESGHFYWDRLIGNGGPIDQFRAMFGDERQDYAQALQTHYAQGGSIPGWEERFVSAYATSHPWEDWAETWAHYLHMIDLLETAAAYGTRIALPGDTAHAAGEITDPFTVMSDFDALVADWVPLTLLVNSLNRSLGQEDAYPFVLSPPAHAKLRFVHETIRRHRD